jgi:SAM-dependent methyltransferase
MAEGSTMKNEFEYVGKELELFRHAENWKRYVARRMAPYLSGQVLEVGAGLGANAPYLYREDFDRFVSLEPDPRLCGQYRDRQAKGLIPSSCQLIEGTLDAISEDRHFDSLVYFDVLEHIEDDREEVRRAMEHLRPGGHLIVLCPAHNWLFSPFDEAIGHFRRYDKPMYRRLSDHRPIRIEYLDSVGLLASIANKLILKQSYPNEKQIRLWDRVFVQCSKLCDPATFGSIGKSLLGVWKK